MLLQMCLQWMDCGCLLRRKDMLPLMCKDCMCLMGRKGMLLKMCFQWMDCTCLLGRKCMLLKRWMDCRSRLNMGRKTMDIHTTPDTAQQDTCNKN